MTKNQSRANKTKNLFLYLIFNGIYFYITSIKLFIFDGIFYIYYT